MIILPVQPSLGAFNFTASIDDVQYRFTFRWNSTEAAWFMDVAEFDGTAILNGVKIVCGVYLGRHSNHPLLLNGVFVARSNAPVHRDPGFDDLGVTVQLLYFNRADYIAELLGSFSEATT